MVIEIVDDQRSKKGKRKGEERKFLEWMTSVKMEKKKYMEKGSA